MRTILAVVLMLTTAACSRSAPTRGHPALDADGCGSSGLDLPVNAVVLDSAALSARLVGLLPADAPDTVSLLVRQGATSATASVRRAHGFPADVARALERAVVDDLLPTENPHGNPPYRLVVDRRSGALSFGRVRICPPELLNRDELVAAMSRAAASMPRSAEALVRIVIDTAGVPSDVTIVQSSSEPNVDAMALAIGGLSRYRPATWDDVPVEGGAMLPVGFNVGRRN